MTDATTPNGNAFFFPNSISETVNVILRNPQMAIGWALEHLPHLHLWDFFKEWKETDEVTWTTDMTKWATYAYDSKRSVDRALPHFAPLAQWAVEAIDEGRMDRSELYDFTRDWLAGKDMGTWTREDVIRREIAGTISSPTNG